MFKFHNVELIEQENEIKITELVVNAPLKVNLH